MENKEKIIINKAMKDFRKTQSMAKADGLDINSIFYFGERLTPLQIDILKEFIYGLSEANGTLGKDEADVLLRNLISEIMIEMLLDSIMK